MAGRLTGRRSVSRAGNRSPKTDETPGSEQMLGRRSNSVAPIVFRQMPPFLFFFFCFFFLSFSIFWASNPSRSAGPPDDYINTFPARTLATRSCLLTCCLALLACFPSAGCSHPAPPGRSPLYLFSESFAGRSGGPETASADAPGTKQTLLFQKARRIFFYIFSTFLSNRT